MAQLKLSPVIVALAVALGACGTPPGAAPPPSPSAEPGAPTIEQTVGDPFAAVGALEQEKLPAKVPDLPLIDRDLPKLPRGLDKAPPSCGAFVARAAVAMDCGGRDQALSSFADALSTTDVAKRDGQLAGLESCGELPGGMVRAIRAELAPPECGDAIVKAVANAPPAGTGGAVHDTLLGLGLAGMLSRAAKSPPKFKGKPNKKEIKAFISNEMVAWTKEQAVAIEQLSGLGSKLRYYGKAIVAVEAGMADMRFIDAVRSVPVPEEFEKDEELRETYYQGLERELEPRKIRGRDAALVGLGSLAFVGVLRDPRVERARKLLSRMFGGRPINALDALLLPPLEPVEANSPELLLAARLQTFYAGLVFAPEAANDAPMLRMLVEKGLSLPHRIALRANTNMKKDVRLLAARARLELGQNYWRRVDFDEAAAHLKDWQGERPPEAKVILGVALALRGGHANAADMMVKAPLSDLKIGRVTALDVLVAGGGPYAGMAAFDAALIKKLAAPVSAPAAYWQDLAQRFDKAHGMLEDARHKEVAAGFATEAKETAEAIEKMPK